MDATKAPARMEPPGARAKGVDPLTEDNSSKRDYGYVYLIEGQDCYKIGRSVNVPQRAQYLDIALPFDVQLIDYVGVSSHRAVESALHRLYAPSRLKGEWFKLTQEQVAEFQTTVLQLEEPSSQSRTYRTREEAVQAAEDEPEATYIARVKRRYVFFPTWLSYPQAVARFRDKPSIVGVVISGTYESFSGK